MSSKSSASAASANVPPRQPVDESTVNPPAYSPPPSSIPQTLPLWTSKYDGVCLPDPESPTPDTMYQPCRPDSVIRVDSSNKKDPLREIISPLLPNSSPIADVVSIISTLATAIPPTCYLWELIRRESDQNFSIKVFVQGEWRRLTVSGLMLTDNEGDLIWPCTTNPIELWPSLLAKAAAIIPYVPAFTLFTGLSVVDYEDFNAIPNGLFAKPVVELSPSRRLFNLATLKPFNHTSAYTDHTKPFHNKTETLLNVASQSPQLVLLSLDPARSLDGRSRVECDIRRYESLTATADVIKIITDGPYHRLLMLMPGLYQISAISQCGVNIAIRSESEAVSLDPEGHSWTLDPYYLHVTNFTGKHIGAPGPHLFTIFFQIAIVSDSITDLLPVIHFDDERLEFLAELVPDSGEPVRVRSGSVIEHVAPGSYILRAFKRSGPEHGILPGSFSVRLLGTRALSCNLISHSNVAKTFSDVFRAASRDLRIFREIISSNSKEPIIVAIDVHVEPADVKFVCRVDNGTPFLGIGRLAVPMIKIIPGQKVTIDCRLDHELSWETWRLRISPGDNVQVLPSSDRRDKLEALKKQWGETDPGRQERGLQIRQAFLNRSNPNDTPAWSYATSCPEQPNNVQEVTAAAAAIRSDYISTLTNSISSTKLFTEQLFQKCKSILEEQMSERDRYRTKILQYEKLLSAINEAVEEGDAKLVISKIEEAKSVPSWKVGRSIYQGYAACFDIHNKALKQAIEEEDTDSIFASAKAAEMLDDLPIIKASVYAETIETRTKAVAIVANEAIKPLNDALAQAESEDVVESIRELMSDKHLDSVKQLKLIPPEFHQSIQRAQERLNSQSPSLPT